MLNLDPHNVLSSNLFTKTLTANNFRGKYKLYLFDYPVYKESLALKLNGRPLDEGVDYYVGHRYLVGTMATAQALIGSVWSITPPRNQSVEIKGRYLGGEYAHGLGNRYVSYCDSTVPDKDTWDSIIGDKFFPAVDIKFDIESWFGESALINSIDSLAAEIPKNPTDDTRYKMALDKLNYILDIINDSKWFNHLTDYNNPHDTKAFQIGALRSDDVAQNSDKAYNKSIAQLLRYIKDLAPNLSHLPLYAKLASENRLSGDLVFDDELGILRGPAGSCTDMEIDLAGGNAKFVSNKSVLVLADRNKKGGYELLLTVGANTLKIVSTGSTKHPSKLYINDELVLTEANVVDNLPSINLPEFIVNHSSGEIRFSGKGTRAEPLTGSADIPQATANAPGTVKLASSLNDNSFAVVATPKLMKQIDDDSKGLVPYNRTINGQSLADNVTITKADLGLGSTDNTNDNEKPLSDASKLALDNKSPKNHTHTLKDFNVPLASYTDWGVGQTAVENQPSPLGTASPKYCKTLEAKESELRRMLESLVSNYVMPVKIARTNGNITVTTEKVTYSEEIDVYFPDYQTQVSPIELDIRGYRGDVVYIYANLYSDNRLVIEASNQYQSPSEESALELGRIIKSGGRLVSHTLKQSVLSLGYFDTMLEHMRDTKAHGMYGADAGSLGIANMPNYGLSSKTDTDDNKYVTVERVKYEIERLKNEGIAGGDSVRVLEYVVDMMALNIVSPPKLYPPGWVLKQGAEHAVHCSVWRIGEHNLWWWWEKYTENIAGGNMKISLDGGISNHDTLPAQQNSPKHPAGQPIKFYLVCKQSDLVA